VTTGQTAEEEPELATLARGGRIQSFTLSATVQGGLTNAATVAMDEADDRARRFPAFDWIAAIRSLDERGHATLKEVLTPAWVRRRPVLVRRCGTFRSRVVIARHGFGEDE